MPSTRSRKPRRRAIIDVLADRRPHAVGEAVRRQRLPQPAVSKHLGVLRRVGIVSAHRLGRQRLYRLNARELKPVHDWAGTFERFWSHQLERIKQRDEREALVDLAAPLSRALATTEARDEWERRLEARLSVIEARLRAAE
jgi:DNA-binding transcriptional ArsR family regulator